MNELVVLILVFFALWGGHWMPWWVIPAIVDEERLLLRPLAYAYGCTCIFCGVVLWTGLITSQGITQINPWITVRFLALDIMAAGLGTMAPRGIKLFREYRALMQDNEDYEQTVKERE